MKKISLKDVKESLKRDEMRMISGGCGSGGSCVSTTACASGCSDGWYCNGCFTCSGGKPPR